MSFLFGWGFGAATIGAALSHNWYGRKQPQKEGGMPARKSVEPGKKLGDPQYQIDPKDNRQFPAGTLEADFKNMSPDSIKRSLDNLYKNEQQPPKTVYVPESKEQYFVKGGRVYLPSDRTKMEASQIEEIKYQAQFRTAEAMKRASNPVIPDVVDSRTSLGGPSRVVRFPVDPARPDQMHAPRRAHLKRQPSGSDRLSEQQ